MSCPPTNIKFQLRRSTSSAWTATNPVIKQGEPGFDITTNQLKIGDGVTSWNSLPYLNNPNGNTLVVDSVYGNDTIAALNPYRSPFLTIQAALNSAGSLALASSVGQNVRILAGVYNEVLNIPSNVSMTGDSVQTVIIQKLNVTANTTLITVNPNCRFENFTARLSSTGNYNLIGVDFLSGTPQTSKLRNSVWTITSSSTAPVTILGVRSSGTSSVAYSTPNAIQRSTFNVISSSLGITRGIYINGPNRFSVRDIVVYVSGTGIDMVGAETTDISSVFEIKTSTIGGVTTNPGGISHDINRTAGTILVGATDLLNNDANGNSFTPTQAPASFQFGTVKSLGANTRYYLLPGTSTVINLESDPGLTYTPSKAFPIAFSQPSTVIEINVTYVGLISTGQSITFNVHKNNNSTPALTITLNPGENTRVLTTQSVQFNTGDTMECTLVTTGNPAANTQFSSSVYYY